MSQQRSNHAPSLRVSIQTSREDEEICSNKATRGSSDPGIDDLGLILTRSRSSERPQRPISMLHPLDQQSGQTSSPDTADATPGTLSLGSDSFMGLTPPPLPSVMVPAKKRPLDEVLKDETLPEKDKMSAEIDQLAGEAPSQPQQKRSRIGEEPSTVHTLLNPMNDPATHLDRCSCGSDGCYENVPDASHHNNRATSD